jgi:hypothetical protein
MPNTSRAQSRRLTIAVIAGALALVAITLLILALSDGALGPDADAGGLEAPEIAPTSSPGPGARPVEETVRLRPNAFCTKRRCRQQNPCCNSCGHRSWTVEGSELEARAKEGKLPRCSVNGCGGCGWALEATGYREGAAFVAVRWRRVGRRGRPQDLQDLQDLQGPSGASGSALGVGPVWIDVTEPSQRQRRPWGRDSNIKTFFASHGVKVMQVKLTPRSSCRALRCPPGRTVQIQVQSVERKRVWHALGKAGMKGLSR